MFDVYPLGHAANEKTESALIFVSFSLLDAHESPAVTRESGVRLVCGLSRV
jgi:hypothetical protein